MKRDQVGRRITTFAQRLGRHLCAALAVTLLTWSVATPTARAVEMPVATNSTATQASTPHMIIGHRGGPDSSGAGENTLRAFRWLMARGIDIEGDVRRTSDGRMVMFHDDSVRPKCIGTRARSIEVMSFAQVRRMRCYATRQRVPALTAILVELRLHPGVRFSLEIKHARSASLVARRATARHVMRLVARSGVQASVSYQEFDHRVIRTIHHVSPSARIEYLDTVPTRAGVRRAVALGASTYSYDVRNASAEINRFAHGLSVSITNWTCTLKQAQRAFDRGADSVMTDDPATLIRRL